MGTIEENELIAEFMGLHKSELGEWKDGGNEKALIWIDKGTGYRLLRYHESWEWLMKVVEKIHLSKQYKPYFTHDIIGVEINIKPNFCHIYLPDTSEGYDYVNSCYEAEPLFSIVNANLSGGTIECVYRSVVEFIKWYNKQNK